MIAPTDLNVIALHEVAGDPAPIADHARHRASDRIAALVRARELERVRELVKREQWLPIDA